MEAQEGHSDICEPLCLWGKLIMSWLFLVFDVDCLKIAICLAFNKVK